MKRNFVDWRLLAGFAALLFLIVAIGAVGVIQVHSLSGTVEVLGKNYLPMQKAMLEMKTSNGLYAMAVRDYIFWKKSGNPGAAALDADLRITGAVFGFDKSLAGYSANIRFSEQKQWVDRISAEQKELRTMGDKVKSLADKIGETKDGARRPDMEDTLDKLVIAFENRLYAINDFFEKTVEKDSLASVNKQLITADLTRKQAVFFLAISLAVALFFGSQTAWFVYRDRKRERERRERLVSKMIKMEEELRRNLSMQIHDQMGQDLSGLKIYLDLINKGLEGKEEALKKDIAEGRKIITDLIRKGHNIAEFLRPPALEEVGLIDTVDALIVQYKKMTDMHFTYQKPTGGIKLSGEYALFLYRVVQEALTNVIKHSHAKNVYIKLEDRNSSFRVSIADDGAGFDYKRFLAERRRRSKLGLMGLEERAELLGGKVSVATSEGNGMTLTAQLPK